LSEIHGHSEGIWRTFAVKRTKDTNFVPKEVQEWLDKNAPHWSFQRYSVQENEPAHISFRIEFPNSKVLDVFRKFLPQHREVLAETSWDEHISVKRAYEFGTRLFFLYLSFEREANLEAFIQQGFHGFFNDLNQDYREECSIYIRNLARLAPYMEHGFSLHNLEEGKEELK
jgi:hypothetical protein